ncbi:hypothetical protein F5144DRAFT_559193 [Chaetomium tenue]|uniref:Uncharacterized protein n=1 Tax=Chaetomium tenue TaxID=1854479 RepID=A0ACB7PQF9_9PEZI|nr:hypothetical protein F5144DRAFT_559193 [Chaetomium globosum]
MTRAAFPVPGQSNQAYFFHGTKYAKVKYTASTSDDEIIYGPTEFAKEWKTLAQAGFSTVDAVLPVPGQASEVYVFSGTRYVRIKFTPGTPDESIIAGPHDIAGYWPSLASAGFQTVDAAFPVPGKEDEAYVFSGNQYAKIRYHAGKTDDVVTYGPKKFTEVWSTLNKAGFDTIDAALPVAGHSDQVYYFSGSQYVKVEFTPSSSTEKILYGPARVAEVWKSLAWGW